MKYIILLFILGISQSVSAQHETKPTDYFTIEGKVKQVIKFTLEDATDLNSISFDSIVIYNHLVVRKSVLQKVKGVLLKDILTKVSFDNKDPKSLSEYFITCIASDGYKVVFSWNEIFNSSIGKQLMVITEVDGVQASSLSQRIAIISPVDMATGRRYVHGLSRIVVNKVE